MGIEKVAEAVKWAFMRATIRSRFLGFFLATLPVEEDRNVETACTTGRKIYYNPEWFATLSRGQILFVLYHEVLHVMFKHLTRFGQHFRDGRAMKANIATDLAINSIIINDLMPKDSQLERPAEILYKEEYRGMSAEKIYSLLPDQPQSQSFCSGNGGEKRNDKGGKGYSGQIDDHAAGAKKMGGEAGDDPEKTKKLEKDIDGKMVRISEAMGSQSRGLIPDEIARMIDKYLKDLRGIVDWKRYIRNVISTIGRDEETYRRVNRNWLQNGMVIPGLQGTGAKIACALDTSGSISDKDIVDFLGEVKGMLKQFRGLTVLIYNCDADIHAVLEIKGIQQFNEEKIRKVMNGGGGGTSHRPIFKDLIGRHDPDIKALFAFTDGYSDINEIPVNERGRFKTYWILGEQNQEVDLKWGTKVIIPKKD